MEWLSEVDTGILGREVSCMIGDLAVSVAGVFLGIVLLVVAVLSVSKVSRRS